MKKKILLFAILSLLLIGCGKKQSNDLQNIANLTSSEYKLLLNPEKFDDYRQGFKDYWSIIQEVAKENNITILFSDEPLKQSHKNIGFFDTKNLDLRKNGYMIRRKIKFNDGVRKPGVEFSLKFRDIKPEVSFSADVLIAEGYTPKEEHIELESDVVYYSVSNGDLETTFSVQNIIELDDNPPMTVGGFAQIYPALATLGLPLDEELTTVAENEPVEYMVRPGKLDFGDGLYGRMDMTIWFVELDGKQLGIPEFSFDHPFSTDKKYNDEAMNRCTTFINKLEEKYPDWVTPGKLKAAYLFEFAENQLKENK